MNIHEEFNRKLASQIKQYKLAQASIDSVKCDNCGGVVNYYGTKFSQEIKLQACYQCGPGSIQVIS